MNDDNRTAREWLREADALLVTAGAGMGVDSGLPDFRGTKGFWKAYPPYEKLGLEFFSVANPQNFIEAPAFGWGFYGHRYNLYRSTEPHEGFGIIKTFAKTLPAGCFVYTSNVDGHFEKAGFNLEQIAECHGSINHYQCVRDCRGKVREADWDAIAIDESTMNAEPPLPTCPDCGEVARPAILMFGDWGWNDQRTLEQENRYYHWLENLGDQRLVVLEMGAGTSIPTVRMQSERVAFMHKNSALIRVNPREPDIPENIEAVGLPLGALQAIRELLTVQ